MKNYKQIYAYQDAPGSSHLKKKSSMSINNNNSAYTGAGVHQKKMSTGSNIGSTNPFLYKNMNYKINDVSKNHSKNFQQAIINNQQQSSNSGQNSQNQQQGYANTYQQNREQYSKSHKNSLGGGPLEQNILNKMIKRQAPYQSQPTSMHQSPKFNPQQSQKNQQQQQQQLLQQQQQQYQNYVQQQQQNNNNEQFDDSRAQTSGNGKPISFLNYLLLKDIPQNQQQQFIQQQQQQQQQQNPSQNSQQQQHQQQQQFLRRDSQQSQQKYGNSSNRNEQQQQQQQQQQKYSLQLQQQQNSHIINNTPNQSQQSNPNTPKTSINQNGNNGNGNRNYVVDSNISNNNSKMIQRQTNSTSAQSPNSMQGYFYDQDSTPTSQKPYTKDQGFIKNQYQYQYVIGKGGFGKVWKVEHKKMKKIFALKEMSKALIITKKSVNSVMNERNLLERLKHEYIVNMQYAFQDRDNLYLVMDLMYGGDLRYHIGRQRRFNEQQTRFFVCCIFLGLEYLHDNNIIHRDIKPENLVLDHKGYVRITDLGIAREMKPDNQNDTSGTPGYMAPEVMCRQPHTFAVDYFALGVLAYEFMLGRRPYLGRSRKEIRDQILAKRVQIKKNEIPPGWSLEGADFINRLIERKPANRLGIHGPAEVKSHPWIKNFPWKKLLNKELQAPFIPGKADNFDNKQQITVEDEQNNELLQQNAILLKRPSVQNLFNGYNFDQENIILNSHQSSTSQQSNSQKYTTSTQASSRNPMNNLTQQTPPSQSSILQSQSQQSASSQQNNSIKQSQQQQYQSSASTNNNNSGSSSNNNNQKYVKQQSVSYQPRYQGDQMF